MKLKEKYISILIVVIALAASSVIFYFKNGGILFPGATPKIKAELPAGFPEEFLVDKDAAGIVGETRGDNQINAMFASKMKPGELLDRFISSAKASGWQIGSSAGSDSFAQASAFKSGTGSAMFQATKMSDSLTQVFVRYLK